MVVVVRDGNVVYIPSVDSAKEAQMLKNSNVTKFLPVAARIRQKSVSSVLLEQVLRDDSALGSLFERYPNLLSLLDASIPMSSKAQTVSDFLSSGIVLPDDLKNKLISLSQEIRYTTRFGAPKNFSVRIEQSLDKINKVLGHDIYERLLTYNLVSDDIPQLVNGVFTPTDIIKLNEAGISELEVRNLLKEVMPLATDNELDKSLTKVYQNALFTQVQSVDNNGEELAVPAEVIGDPVASVPGTNIIQNTVADAANEPQENQEAGGQSYFNSTQPIEQVQQSDLFTPEDEDQIEAQVQRIMGDEAPVPVTDNGVTLEQAPDTTPSTPTTVSPINVVNNEVPGKSPQLEEEPKVNLEPNMNEIKQRTIKQDVGRLKDRAAAITRNFDNMTSDQVVKRVKQLYVDIIYALGYRTSKNDQAWLENERDTLRQIIQSLPKDERFPMTEKQGLLPQVKSKKLEEMTYEEPTAVVKQSGLHISTNGAHGYGDDFTDVSSLTPRTEATRSTKSSVSSVLPEPPLTGHEGQTEKSVILKVNRYDLPAPDQKTRGRDVVDVAHTAIANARQNLNEFDELLRESSAIPNELQESLKQDMADLLHLSTYRARALPDQIIKDLKAMERSFERKFEEAKQLGYSIRSGRYRSRYGGQKHADVQNFGHV